MTGSLIYVNGASIASTVANSGSFVTMRDTTKVVGIGASDNATPGQYFSGSVFGGPFGPTFVQAQLTAAQVLRDYELWRGAIGLGV